ncbi:MAG: hypothetical protein J5J06_15395 [Phycisphaerae bacterium]|nr:hypothetical protein [Phycisphaerae bacterium]
MPSPNVRLALRLLAWTASILLAVVTAALFVTSHAGSLATGVFIDSLGEAHAGAEDGLFILLLSRAEPVDALGFFWAKPPRDKQRRHYVSFSKLNRFGNHARRWELDCGRRTVTTRGGRIVPITRLLLHVPSWFLLAAGVTPLLLLVASEIRRCRIPPGHCRKCRYDLTGNTSGICPECGTPIPPEPSLGESDGSGGVERDATQHGGGT